MKKTLPKLKSLSPKPAKTEEGEKVEKVASSVKLPVKGPTKTSKPLASLKPVVKKVEKKEVEEKEEKEISKPSPKAVPVSPKAKPTSPKSNDPRKYLHTFFGKRNGKKEPKVVEGVNYDIETLSYMSSQNGADAITDRLVEKMRKLGKIPFEVIELASGIGGNTLSFLDNENIIKVTAYEILPERRKMLESNIALYNFEDKVDIVEEFPSLCIPAKNSLLFSDPPWIQTGVKGHLSTKDDYAMEGITLEGRTLEELAIESRCDVVAYRLPPGYNLKLIPGYSLENEVLKNVQLSIYSKKKTRNRAIEESREKEEHDRWSVDLKDFLRNVFLKRILKNEEALDKLVSPEAMAIWEVAFTHESFNANKGENYEELEMYGDTVLDAAYIKFIIKSYPQFDRQQLSELRQVYLAKGFQGKLAQQLGLAKYIRTNFPKNISTSEDILESFFGALEGIGDKVFKFGAGFGLCYNMAVNLYKDVPIEVASTISNAKTQVKEIYEGLKIVDPKLGERVPEQTDTDGNGMTVVSILMPRNGKEILREIGISIEDVVGSATDYTKKMAGKTAYQRALAYLTDLGLTREYIAEVKRSRNITEINLLKPHIEAIQERLKEEGYETFDFIEHHVGTSGAGRKNIFVQLIGKKPDGYRKILATTYNPVESVVSGKVDLLKEYASN